MTNIIFSSKGACELLTSFGVLLFLSKHIASKTSPLSLKLFTEFKKKSLIEHKINTFQNSIHHIQIKVSNLLLIIFNKVFNATNLQKKEFNRKMQVKENISS